MKKLFYILDAFLGIISLISIVAYAISGLAQIGVMSQVFVVIFAGFNLVGMYVYKNKKGILTAGLILLGLILAVIGNAFIVRNVTAFYVLLCLAELTFVIALLFNSKFSYFDIIYMLVLAMPIVLFVNLAPIFGFSGALNRVLASLLMATVSAVLGLSVAHLVKKNSAFNISFTIVAFFNLIYCFGLLILKQSNVTHQIKPIITTVFYALLLCFSATMLLLLKKSEKNENKASTKRNVANTVNLFLVTIIICYTIASNFLAFNFVSAKIYKDKFLSMVNNDLEIPIVEIYTQDNEEPQNKTDYVNCSFEISNCENEADNFSVQMAKNYEDEGCVGIRLRGNSTMKARKRPYRIKFDEEQSFFGLKANKSWVLLADYYDQSYIRNYAAFTLADKFDNLDFTPTPHHVALIINNEFKGLYVLCEQMDEKKGRANVDEDFDVAVDKEFPFLIEMDVNAGSEGITGIDNFYVEGINHAEIKYPEADERGRTETSDVVYDYIYEYLNAVAKTIQTNEKVEVSFRDTPVSLEDLVDIDSAVDYYLVNEIMLNIDSAYKSIYFHKTKDGKLEFGPVWDFDFSCTTELVAPFERSYIEGTSNMFIAKNSVIFKHLMKNETFYNKVVARYNVMNNAILETCDALKEYKNVIDEVALIDAKMWHGTTGEFQYDMQYDYVRLFLQDRHAYLNTIFAKSHAEFLSSI